MGSPEDWHQQDIQAKTSSGDSQMFLWLWGSLSPTHQGDWGGSHCRLVAPGSTPGYRLRGLERDAQGGVSQIQLGNPHDIEHRGSEAVLQLGMGRRVGLSPLSGFALLRTGTIQNKETKAVTQLSSLLPKGFQAQPRGKQAPFSKTEGKQTSVLPRLPSATYVLSRDTRPGFFEEKLFLPAHPLSRAGI